MIVSDIAGTTRDAADTVVNTGSANTSSSTPQASGARPGWRRRSSAIAFCGPIWRWPGSDVCVIVIDATVGFTEQDSKVAGYAHEQGKGCVVAVNKWDAIDKDDKTMDEFRKKLEVDFSFMSYVPFVFISALTGQRVNKLFEMINYVFEKNAMRISTGRLNDLLAYATARVQPPPTRASG